MSNNIEALIAESMYSSIEGYVSLVVNSIEFEMSRELTDAEYKSVCAHVENAIIKASELKND